MDSGRSRRGATSGAENTPLGHFISRFKSSKMQTIRHPRRDWRSTPAALSGDNQGLGGGARPACESRSLHSASRGRNPWVSRRPGGVVTSTDAGDDPAFKARTPVPVATAGLKGAGTSLVVAYALTTTAPLLAVEILRYHSGLRLPVVPLPCSWRRAGCGCGRSDLRNRPVEDWGWM